MAGLGYKARHTATAYTNAASVIFQLSTSSASPITIQRIQLQSSATTSAQSVITLQYGTYATGHAAGTTVTPQAITRRNAASSNTGVRIASATLGTTFTPIDEIQWNIALPLDLVFGLPSLQIEMAASQVFALIIPSASGTPTLSGSIDWVEY